MKWKVITAEKLKEDGWVTLGSFTKKTIILIKEVTEANYKIIIWNCTTMIVEMAGDLL